MTLDPGKSQTVTFTLGPQNLGYYNNNGQFEVQPGPFDLWVGDSSTADTGYAHDVHGRMRVRGLIAAAVAAAILVVAAPAGAATFSPHSRSRSLLRDRAGHLAGSTAPTSIR